MGKRSRKRSGQPEGSAAPTGSTRAERDAARRRRAEAARRGEAVARREEGYRCLIEEMLLAPEEHKWVRVGNEDIGEPGCKHWHVRPRWGVVGMLLNWWRVKISSGCPLAGGYG